MSRSHFHRARVRNFLFTVGPNRLSGGRLQRRHLAKDIVCREFDLTVPRWPAAFDGVRIAHVSDFHLGRLITLEHALRAVAVIESVEPDLVACTGDVIDLHHGPEMHDLLGALAQVTAPLGSMLVVGNHDELDCGRGFRDAARDAGLTLLDDDVVTVRHGDAALRIGGIGWARTEAQCRHGVDRACAGGCDLLLAHNPKAFPAAAAHDVPLTLSGHTHGGQVALPGRPNVNLSITHKRSAGLFTMGDSVLHVTTGVGSWFPLRMNCPAEVAVMTVHAGASS